MKLLKYVKAQRKTSSLASTAALHLIRISAEAEKKRGKVGVSVQDFSKRKTGSLNSPGALAVLCAFANSIQSDVWHRSHSCFFWLGSKEGILHMPASQGFRHHASWNEPARPWRSQNIPSRYEGLALFFAFMTLAFFFPRIKEISDDPGSVLHILQHSLRCTHTHQVWRGGFSSRCWKHHTYIELGSLACPFNAFYRRKTFSCIL